MRSFLKQSSSHAAAAAAAVPAVPSSLSSGKKKITVVRRKKKAAASTGDDLSLFECPRLAAWRRSPLFCGATPQDRFTHFGIMGFAAPPERDGSDRDPLPAFFKQHWSDFVVTEIPCVTHNNSSTDMANTAGTPVKRATSPADFVAPAFPTWLADGIVKRRLANDLASSEADTAAAMSSGNDQEQQQSNDPTAEITSASSLFAPADEVAAAIARRQQRAEQMFAEAREAFERQEQAVATQGSHQARRNQSKHNSRLKQDFYLQCVLRKKRVSHTDALALVARALRLHPDRISISGIKDFNGDTAQIIRLQGVSPSAAIRANFWISTRISVEWGGRRELEKKNQTLLAEASSAETRTEEPKTSSLSSSSSPPSSSPSRGFRALLEQSAPALLLSNFSYERSSLQPGRLVGNHFKIVLRGIPADSKIDARLDRSAEKLRRYGFPNFFGCQRFSWFGDKDVDPSHALLQGDVVGFAYRLLNFTDGKHTMRELLQRKHLYPMQLQESFRRAVVSNLKEIGMTPTLLDSAHVMMQQPELGLLVPYDAQTLAMNFGMSSQEVNTTIRVDACFRQALLSVSGTGRRLICQSTCSYLWNLTLAERIRKFGLQRVLAGDLVYPREELKSRVVAATPTRSEYDQFARMDAIKKSLAQQVTAAEAASPTTTTARTSIFEVCHPRFNFHGEDLRSQCAPAIADIMMRCCKEHSIMWESCWPRRLGLANDFCERPRPICAMPSNFEWRRSRSIPDAVEIEFGLVKGSYANVCIREFLRGVECPGADDVLLRPVPDALWWTRGAVDPGAKGLVAEDLYPTFTHDNDDGIVTTPMDERAEPLSIYDYDGEWSRPDEKRQIKHWSSEVMLRNCDRHQKFNVLRAKELFEPALRRNLSGKEIMRYAGHTVPLPPNAPRKQIARKVFRLKMKNERDPRRRKLLCALHRKTSRTRELEHASRDMSWTPQR